MRYTDVIKNKKNIFLSILFGVVFSTHAQEQPPRVFGFENPSILQYFTTKNSQIAISKKRHRFGKNSLFWQWKAKGEIRTSHFKMVSKKESPLAYGDFFPSSPTFVFSIYNEHIQEGNLTFTFKKANNGQVWFQLPLKFTGWRHFRVPYFEMQGESPKKNESLEIKELKITSSTDAGAVYLDDVIISQYEDDRHPYPDQLVPFIKKEYTPSSDHWMPMNQYFKNIQRLNSIDLNNLYVTELEAIETKIANSLKISDKYKLYIDSVKDQFSKLNISEKNGIILAPPLTYNNKEEFFDESIQGKNKPNKIQDLGKVLLTIANYYDRANESEKKMLKAFFVLGTKYFLDQGWQAGSSGGTRHHIGYSVREITRAFFIMRSILKQEKLLNDVGNSLHWLFNLGMLLDNPKEFHVNIDYLNTQSYFHLMLVYLIEDKSIQAQLLKAYSRYISITLAQQQEEWGFKIDGTVWHHNGHYPAYGLGAFKEVSRVINILSGTKFKISQQGHQNFKNAFLATQIYCQKYDWGFGNAGRHPLESDKGNNISSLQDAYLLMANSGNPEGTSKIDIEVASAYRRLWEDKDLINNKLFGEIYGIKKANLDGYYTFPYGATSVHRRNNWAALIKGYSKYVWSSEIYVASNRYGRYPANGSIQLLNEKGEQGSGFQQQGWDWNRFPGTTVINLPLKELESNKPLLMFRSKETFAGAVSLNGNGVFAMILDEGNGINADGENLSTGFPEKLYAKKSVFSFDKKLICIGTNISSENSTHPTQTNLFQNALTDKKATVVVSGKNINQFPYSKKITNNHWIIDSYNNGYYILSGDNTHIVKQHQTSYHNKFSLSTGKMNPKGKGVKETEADYATAWIDHGIAPKDASYQYVIYPFLSENEKKNFEKKVANDYTYQILKADATAHIVIDKKTNTTGYAIFETTESVNTGIIQNVSDPCLLMVHEQNLNDIVISAVQPDLNFEEIRKNKFVNNSRPVTLEITVKGSWKVAESNQIESVFVTDGVTKIKLMCKDGFSVKFNLKKL